MEEKINGVNVGGSGAVNQGSSLGTERTQVQAPDTRPAGGDTGVTGGNPNAQKPPAAKHKFHPDTGERAPGTKPAAAGPGTRRTGADTPRSAGTERTGAAQNKDVAITPKKG